MVDRISRSKRSQMMAGIKGKNTKPEILVRSSLFKRGFRYVLHNNRLPGKPDLVFPKFKAVIFVNGCFWHAHTCHLFKWPSSNIEFWDQKIKTNSKRDIRNLEALNILGWRVMTIWECSLKGKTRLKMDEIVSLCETWLTNGEDNIEIKGNG